jgi:hypothetical protein
MTGLEARQIIENGVRRELFGPIPGEAVEGAPLIISGGSVVFENPEDARNVFVDSESGEEVITIGAPITRFGVGVLHPRGGQKEPSATAVSNELDGVVGLSTVEENPGGLPVEIKGRVRHDVADSDDFDLTDANSFKPSAMAISFECRIPRVEGHLLLEVSGARYEKFKVSVPGKRPFDWWVRRPFRAVGKLGGVDLLNKTNQLIPVVLDFGSESESIHLSAKVFSRHSMAAGGEQSRLVTVSVVNESTGSGSEAAIFQVGFKVTGVGGSRIIPYPEIDLPDQDEEEQSLELLYRNARTYAIGHGCAAEWDNPDGSSEVGYVEAVALPAYEVLSLSPNIYLRDAENNYVLDPSGRRVQIEVSMEELAQNSANGHAQVELVISQYESWISQREMEVDTLPARLVDVANRHIHKARVALNRMKKGWEYIQSNEIAGAAFRLTNQAMLSQQVRSSLPLRKVAQNKQRVWEVQGAHPTAETPVGRGKWRPFQIAFLLSVVPELFNAEEKHRNDVDLIFFPTGGGKTEAYLGAATFSLLSRRLKNPGDIGTDTLMRYTLRLLTAQQFLRAASLICVLEDIRESRTMELGDSAFGIGIWLGGSSTPNTWKQALDNVRALRNRPQEQNLFLLLRCPWCGAQMGPQSKPGGGQEPIGYEESGGKVVLRCIDRACKFSRRAGLPVHVVDEDIYQTQPSIVIGTVDKFAMLAWKPEARRLFGLGDDGLRESSPPSLIIQDELHLISGPLGSMVALYEPVIEDLCTDRRLDRRVKPKIIASTATVRRYEEQVKGVFGRETVSLFPPHGLEEGRSFFAEPATLEDGALAPGRRYLGIFSASLGSTQTVQVRVAAATLQAGTAIPEESRDGYWTNLNFLNSLRELGNTVSLIGSDIPDYLTGVARRQGLKPRWPNKTMELTSRRRSDEIPKAIEDLQVNYAAGKDRQDAIDICLASNIIEVGVDIDRLGLMTIVGQPKTTAQYIQVSGRVGRKPEVSPGLVITIYGAARPRDRSHYERFKTYHQQLYAQVEPTSVTPFATPVLRRALHAVAVAHIRQNSAMGTGPDPFPSSTFDDAIQLLRERAKIVEPDEIAMLDHIGKARARQWANWERTEWNANPAPFGDPLQGLMRFAGTLPDLQSRATIWDVPTSMRNVDAECQLEITQAYLFDNANLEDFE